MHILTTIKGTLKAKQKSYLTDGCSSEGEVRTAGGDRLSRWLLKPNKLMMLTLIAFLTHRHDCCCFRDQRLEPRYGWLLSPRLGSPSSTVLCKALLRVTPCFLGRSFPLVA